MVLMCATGAWSIMFRPSRSFALRTDFTLFFGSDTLPVIAPIMVTFLIFQKYLIDGMPEGLLKG